MDDIKYYLYNGIKKKPYEYEVKQYSDIVVVDSTITKNELYSTFMDWIAKNYVSAQNVIQYQDKEEGKIVAKGLFKVYLNGLYGPEEAGYIYHTISLYVKNGKYKYTIDNIYYEGNTKYGGSADINNSKPAGGMMKQQWVKIREQANSELEKTILSFKDAANKIKKNKEW